MKNCSKGKQITAPKTADDNTRRQVTLTAKKRKQNKKPKYKLKTKSKKPKNVEY